MHDDLSELGDYLTTATRLRPSRGTPAVGESSVGGPLLWPADEEWPVCDGPHEPFDELRWHVDVERERWLRDLRATRPLTDEESEELAVVAGRARLDFEFDDPVEMIPIAQLRRADVPDFVGPDDTDLAQVLWCPMGHKPFHTPDVAVRWRHEADVADASTHGRRLRPDHRRHHRPRLPTVDLGLPRRLRPSSVDRDAVSGVGTAI